MKKFILGLFIFLIGLSTVVTAQEEEPKDKPVRAPFSSDVLIDNVTSVVPIKGTFEWLIEHRFGTMDNGIKDLYGLYRPGANIRLEFNYSILDNLVVAYGLTQRNMYSDFSFKYNVLQQTRQNTIPVAVTLYGDMAIDSRDKSVFGTEYDFGNRLSYFGQVIVGRKFTYWLSIQATGSFTHFNSVAADMNHDVIGLGINGRINFSPQSSIIFQYDTPLKIQSISEQKEFDVAKPNVGLGLEVSTGSHQFQVFVTSSNGLLPQENYMYNQFDYTEGFSDLMFGFTITRLWNF